ncbi:MAG: SIMPL domain-containing protein, partial [Clostridia bacterium]|nr:SIMPL domain-containing protein [Clostridia bacterium]
MERTITVRGTGKLSLAPDLITIMLTIRKKDKDYETAMRGSAQLQEALRSALSEVGFGRDDL